MTKPAQKRQNVKNKKTAWKKNNDKKKVEKQQI